MADRLVNYLRTRRKQAGLSQREVASLLGYDRGGTVSRHELFRSVPPLIMAIAYEVIFQAPIAELFPGLQETVQSAIEKQITEFEARLIRQKNRPHAGASRDIDRKLEWLAQRRQGRATKP